MFGGMGGLGGALELDMLLRAQDEATGIIQGVGAALEAVIGTTANFQTSLTQVQNNTTMTARDVDTMRAAVLALSSQTGAPLNDLAAGFMHITNLGFNAADAVKVLTEANKSAISTGSNTADVANTLALQMHEFGLGASDAGRAMNVLHLAAAEGNATLEQFVTQTSKSVSMAANLGIPIQQVDAALAALSRHMDLSQANTALAGEFSKLVNPAKETVVELQHLSDVTGINLVKDFTAAGMQARGFPGVMDDLKRATGGNVTEMLRLIPAMRGGLAEMVLLGTGSADYTKILDDLTATMGGKTDPTTAAYTRTMGTFNQQLAVVQQNWNQFLMAIGQPILDTLTPYLHQVIDFMTAHKKDIDAFGHALGTTVGGAITNFVHDVPKMFAAAQGEWEKFTKLSDGIGTFFDTLGTNIHNTIRTVAGGIYDLIQSGSLALDQSVNGIVGVINLAIDKFNQVTGQTIPHAGTLPAPDMYVIAQQREAFLTSLVGPAGGGGGGAAWPGVGGHGRYWNPDTFQWQDTPPWAGGTTIRTSSGSGGGGGGGGSGGGGTGTGTGADAPGYLDAQQAIAAATRHLRDAQDIFGIDLSKHRTDLGNAAVHALLVADIGRVVADMVPALGYNALDRQKAQVDYLAQIADHTKTAATHLGVATGQAINPLLGFRLPQEAAFGGSWISFASLQEASDREDRRQLMAQVAALQQQNAALQQQNAALQEGNGHQAATAQATARIASSVGRTPQSVDALLRARGTQMAGR